MLQGVFSLHLTANGHPNPYTAKLPCSFTQAGRPEGWLVGSSGPRVTRGSGAKPSTCTYASSLRRLRGWEDFPRSHLAPSPADPWGTARSSGHGGAEQPERPPYLVAGARPGREGARACGRRGRRAFPPSPSRDPEAPSGSRGLRSTRLQWGPEGWGKLKIIKKQMCLGSPPPTAIHNPADRKRCHVTSCCLLRKRSPPDRVAGTFVSRFGCRLGRGRVRKELPGTDRVAGRSGELWRGSPRVLAPRGGSRAREGRPQRSSVGCWAPPCWGGKPHNLRAVACGILTAPPLGRTVPLRSLCTENAAPGDWVRGTLKPLSKGSGPLCNSCFTSRFLAPLSRTLPYMRPPVCLDSFKGVSFLSVFCLFTDSLALGLFCNLGF